MPRRGAPPLRFSADGPRQLADQIAEQLRNERPEQIAQAPQAGSGAIAGRSATAPRAVFYGPDGTPRSRPRVEDFLDMIMRREGGYVDNPKDRGGRTNFGITQKTLGDWHAEQIKQFKKEEADKSNPKIFEPTRLPGASSIPTDVKDLTKEQARALHKNLVWDKYGLEQINDDNAAAHLFDMLTMSGRHGVSKMVYPAIDSLMKRYELYDHGETPLIAPTAGGIDQTAIDRMNWLIDIGHARDLQEALVNQRLAYVRKLPNFKDFHGGWVPRIEWFRPRSTPPEGWYR